MRENTIHRINEIKFIYATSQSSGSISVHFQEFKLQAKQDVLSILLKLDYSSFVVVILVLSICLRCIERVTDITIPPKNLFLVGFWRSYC